MDLAPHRFAIRRFRIAGPPRVILVRSAIVILGVALAVVASGGEIAIAEQHVLPMFAKPVGPPPYAPTVLFDSVMDAVVRRTDLGADSPVNAPSHRVPDILGYQIGRWEPVNSAVDPYGGAWDPQGRFLRLDVGFVDLVNPPGTLNLSSGVYDPYRYGPHPAFGFIELDVDEDVWTGGETVSQGIRYLANAARFGGKPSTPRFADRIALGGADLDLPFDTAPLVQRSGEEFHVELIGDDILETTELVGNGDGLFDYGETWLVTGRLFHRAHGYEEFSLAKGPPPGTYLPIIDLRWEHIPALSLTLVTLVYPLTQQASAEMRSEVVTEALNGNAFDQNSIEEALDDLIFSINVLPAMDPLRLDPQFPIISAWEGRSAMDYLGAHNWRLNVLAGMAYVNQDPSGSLLAWTDIQDGAIFGDVNGDGLVGFADVAEVVDFVVAHDGDWETDGGPDGDGQIHIVDFGWNFSIYDLNYDGVVNMLDERLVPVLGDLDFDSDVDLDDASVFLVGLLDPSALNPDPGFGIILPRADFSGDAVLDARDIQGFVGRLLAEP